MNEFEAGQDISVVGVSNLTRRFGKKVALNDVSLNVTQGMVLGLVGENGAGKTTLVKHLLGSHYAQEGTVHIFGLDPTKKPVEVLSRMGYVSEDRELPGWMRVSDLIDYTASFYPNWDRTYARELQEMFALDSGLRARALSRGQRARLCLLLALAYRPELLLLDEPSSGLDPLVRKDILTAIIRTVADEGRTVIFSSHLLDEVERVADHVAILHQGSLVARCEMESLRSDFVRCTLRLEDERWKHRNPPDILGAQGTPVASSEWEYVCQGRESQFRAAANDIGGAVVAVSQPTLDDVFSAIASRHGSLRITKVSRVAEAGGVK